MRVVCRVPFFWPREQAWLAEAKLWSQALWAKLKTGPEKSEKTIRGLMFPVIIPAEFSTVYLEAHWARKNPVNRPDKLFPVPGCSLQAEKESKAKEASFPGLWFCAQIQVHCLLCGPRGWGLFPLRNEPGTALWWTGSEFWVRHCTLIWAGRCALMDRQCWPGHFIHWLDRTGEAAQSIWTNKPMRMERRRRYSKPPCNSVESLGGRVEEPFSPCHCPGLCSWELSTLTQEESFIPVRSERWLEKATKVFNPTTMSSTPS